MSRSDSLSVVTLSPPWCDLVLIIFFVPSYGTRTPSITEISFLCLRSELFAIF